MEGESACGSKAGRFNICACCGGKGSLVSPSARREAALAEKKPAPGGGRSRGGII